ncbi:MAG: malto-oligosyltrehalose trehalohydrolase [Phenylobacterium sp.]|uniref:malto-oligosyltrehalose trehalohydrolase n=1 Tax=Phenylobacterium sp. TaxID=1871053 RepID=UPI00391C052E
MSASTFRPAFGAQALGPDRVRFHLWAPAASRVEVVFQDGRTCPLEPAGQGAFVGEASARAAAGYRYRIDGGTEVPDPAARAQTGGPHGWSLTPGAEPYPWRHADWAGRPWEEAVVYELHPGLMGGFEGVARELPRLADLGVTAVELMPVNQFPGARNWGYDGVLPYAPAEAYGGPDGLKALVDRAHGLGLMVLLDVVYNHFGPDGNFLGLYAPQFFRDDLDTPWGVAIDFRRPQVRRFFTDNVLYWLSEFRLDGLRFDAVHAISEPDWLDETAAAVRSAISDRQVHLVLENDANDAERLRRGYDAQWNDDFHHVMHVMLTGERGGYYGDYAEHPAERLARALSQGFVYQGEGSAHRGGEARGQPSGDLAPTAFVDFLQNHDQTGNRALGERLAVLARPQALRAASALVLLSPSIPMIFMGEEVGSRSPFLYFTDHEPGLAEAVREGRRREFASFPEFADPAARSRIPDPNALKTFERSRPAPGPDAAEWTAHHRDLLTLRRRAVVPRLAGAKAEGAQAVGAAAVAARWRMGDGARLTLALNLAQTPVDLAGRPAADPLALIGALEGGRLGGDSFVAWLEPAA